MVSPTKSAAYFGKCRSWLIKKVRIDCSYSSQLKACIWRRMIALVFIKSICIMYISSPTFLWLHRPHLHSKLYHNVRRVVPKKFKNFEIFSNLEKKINDIQMDLLQIPEILIFRIYSVGDSCLGVAKLLLCVCWVSLYEIFSSITFDLLHKTKLKLVRISI